MSGKDRINLFPSRANHVAMKARIVSANKGHSLLKRKRDALELKLREITAKRAGLAENFNALFSGAIFSIAKANFLETDFKPALVIGSERADACMRLTYTKTIGLLLPTFEPLIRKPESLPFTGLSRGGTQVEVIRDKFQELLTTIILLASYDYSIKTVQDSIRTNNMRLNGLEFVVIPRFNNTVTYISEELDEMEREEFYRLKCSQSKQRALRTKENRKPVKGGKEYADAETWTGEDDLKEQEEKFVPLPLAIFMKKKFASAAQTIISGHFPGSFEMISPTDSIISGEVPTVSKRSSFKPLVRETKVETSSKPEEPTETSIKTELSLINETPDTRPSASSVKPMKRVSMMQDDIKIKSAETLLHDARSEDNVSDVPKTRESEISTNASIKSESTVAPATIDEPSSETKPTRASTPSSPSENVKTEDPSAGNSSFFSVPDTSEDTSSAIIDIAHLNVPSFLKAPAVDVHEMYAQTDITGRYPRRSEMDSPATNGSSDPQTARSQTSVPGRHGRGNNTEHGDTSESESEADNNQPNAQ